MPAGAEYIISVIGEDNFTPEVEKMLKELKSLEERASKKGISVGIDPKEIKKLENIRSEIERMEAKKIKLAPFDVETMKEASAANARIVELQKEIRTVATAIQIQKAEALKGTKEEADLTKLIKQSAEASTLAGQKSREQLGERLSLLKSELGIHKPIAKEFEKRYSALTKEEQAMADAGKTSRERQRIEARIAKRLRNKTN